MSMVSACAVCLFTTTVFADLVPFIGGASTAEQVTDIGSPYYLWYKYTITLTWDLNHLGAGLSHWDMIFKADCALSDISFDSPAGYSTSPGESEISWEGLFDISGDTSLEPDVLTPIIKYNEYSAEPGEEGSGTFWFYTQAAPQNGTYTNALVAKAGTIADTYGNLIGDAPPCTIPEPSTILLLGLGLLVLLRRPRKHTHNS